jgi:hypothetical protein
MPAVSAYRTAFRGVWMCCNYTDDGLTSRGKPDDDRPYWYSSPQNDTPGASALYDAHCIAEYGYVSMALHHWK